MKTAIAGNDGGDDARSPRRGQIPTEDLADHDGRRLSQRGYDSARNGRAILTTGSQFWRMHVFA